MESRRLLSATRLDNPLALAGDVGDFQTTPDGQFAVYIADDTTDKVFELYSVELETGTVRKLNDPLAPAGDVLTFRISPNSERVVYQADQSEDEVNELFSVPLTGGGSTRLNGSLTEGGDVGALTFRNFPNFEISPDSSRVVYLADQENNDQIELFSVPLNGGEPTKLNGVLASGNRSVQHGFQISSASDRVVYRAEQDAVGMVELYSVPLSGGETTKLNGVLPPGGNVGVPGFEVFEVFRISSDSSTVVYLADQQSLGVTELFSVPLAGGTATRLNSDLPGGGNVGFPGFFSGAEIFGVFEIAPDSSRVVYAADQETLGVVELFSVPLAGGQTVKLNDELGAGGNLERAFQISPDSTRVVYRADRDEDEVFELFSVPLAGGDVTKLNDALVEGGDVDLLFAFGGGAPIFQVSADSGHVIYLADQETNDILELFSVPLAGGDVVKLNGPLAEGGIVDFRFPQISPDGSRVVYRADQEARLVPELFTVSITGGDSIKLNDSLVDGGEVNGFAFSPDSGTVLYRAEQELAGVFELFQVPVGGGEVTTVSNAMTALGDSVTDVVLSSDGRYAVFRADQTVDDQFELFSVELATGIVTRLNPSLPGGASVRSDFKVSKDGETIVYRANHDSVDVVELFSVPIAGGVSTKLNDALAGVAVLEFEISDDSAHVAYRADQDTRLRFELYTAPISGGGPLKLSGTIGAEQGDVREFAISSDSSRVVYRADQDTDEVFELFSAPLTGGQVTKLNPALVERGDVGIRFEISPDSSRVIYQADQEIDSVDELFSVALAGGDATKLNPTLVGGGDVANFTISSDSTRVVYQSDQDRDNVLELFSVPLVGGEDPTKLNEPLAGGRDVSFNFEVTPDSSRVVYRADQLINGRDELFSVPLLGGDSVRISGPLVSNGNVRPGLMISPDGSRVVYRADQDTDEIEELYSAPIDGVGDVVKLNDMLVEGGEIQGEFKISGNSMWVVYRADQDTDDVFELYRSSLIEGGSTRLNDPLVAAGNVASNGFDFRGFGLTADSNHVLYLADQDTDEQIGLYLTDLEANEETNLVITTAQPTNSGVEVTFNSAFDPSVLNLYDSESGRFGGPDVTLHGDSVGPVTGSLVVDPSNTRVTFLKSGGPLSPDTYALRVRSGDDAFRTAEGLPLDGNEDGTPGDAFEFEFTIVEPGVEAAVVSVPDFVRGLDR